MPLCDLPIRDGNVMEWLPLPPAVPSLRPSYKGWKLNSQKPVQNTPFSLRPSYKGWKLKPPAPPVNISKTLRPSYKGWKLSLGSGVVLAGTYFATFL